MAEVVGLGDTKIIARLMLYIQSVYSMINNQSGTIGEFIYIVFLTFQIKRQPRDCRCTIRYHRSTLILIFLLFQWQTANA